MPTRKELMAKCKKEHPDWTPAQHAAWVEKEMKGVEYAAHSNTIRGIEIFAAGTHNGDAYTEKDLDDMVAAFSDLDFRPAIKVGHTKDQPGAPSYGWVTNLKRVGEKLYADFESMHDSVVEAIRSKAYDRVSSEVYFNLKRGAKTFRRALKAVALLGAEVPAVAGLVPLHKMEFAESGFEGVHAFEQQLEVPVEALIATFSERVSGLIQLFNEKEQTEMKEIKELQAKVAELVAQIAVLKKGDDKDKDAKIVTLSEQAADLGAKIAELAASAGAGETEAQKADRIAREKADKDKDARIAQLEAKDRANQVKDRVAQLKVPAFQPAIAALYAYAVEHAAEKVKVYSIDKDGKQTESEKTLVDIADGIVTSINAQAAKLFKELASTGADQRQEGSEETDPGLELDKRIKKYMVDNKTQDYEKAMTAVLTADGDLEKRYTEQTEQRAAAH